MTVHPSFEELAQFVFARQIDRDYFRMAARINAHLSECQACKEIYRVMLSCGDSAEALAQVKRRGTAEEGPVTVERLIRSGQAFLLKIHSFLHISADALAMTHPLRPVTVKSTGSGGGEGEPLRSALSDGAGNRIRVDEDGSLTLYFDRRLLAAGARVRLRPADSSLPEQTGTVSDYDQLTVSVCFDDIMPGEFYIEIEPERS